MAVDSNGAPATAERELWGPETAKAVVNFPVSGERVPTPVVRWLGRIKAEAARVNAELGLLDGEVAERIARAGDEVAEGKHDDQFPIDVFQTGSGTSTNMNANEVIANLAGDDAHANDHVNMGQSSNDVFPSAVHLAAVDSVQRRAAAGARAARRRVRHEGRRVRRPRQGRAHAHDGRRPRHARPGVRRLPRADHAEPRPHSGLARPRRADPARRHRHGHRPQHASRVRRARARAARAGLGAARPLRGSGQPRRARRAARARSRAWPSRSRRSPTTSC